MQRIDSDDAADGQAYDAVDAKNRAEERDAGGETNVERLARETLNVTRGHATNACAYAEAYGHEGRTVVVDGSTHSPSTRALPGASVVWGMEDADAWTAYDEIVGDGCEEISVQCHDSDGREDDPEYAWTMVWEDGCLFAIHPDAESDD